MHLISFELLFALQWTEQPRAWGRYPQVLWDAVQFLSDKDLQKNEAAYNPTGFVL